MSEKNLDKNLEICFEIKTSNRFNISHTLIYRSSNYELSMDEITRASLRPLHLILDNKSLYVKIGETAEPKDDKNILRINYLRHNTRSK